MEEKRSRTAESMMIEARIRRENPVHGPVEIQRRLRDEIEKLQNELEIVQSQLHSAVPRRKTKLVD
ncbi:LOB domain-containing protein 27-like [Dorcoceras hygrometricum]|nr:LOB domain-containing protein 27-like [Dorcoceras hygrometricum]